MLTDQEKKLKTRVELASYDEMNPILRVKVLPLFDTIEELRGKLAAKESGALMGACLGAKGGRE